MRAQNPNRAFWSGKRVLITGHTGFKGAWLSLWLDKLGAKVGGLSLNPSTQPNLFEAANVKGDVAHTICDIRDAEKTAICVANFKPEIVFHLAAQALVRPSYNDPLDTFSTNVMGTAHVLDAIRRTSSVSTCVVATTDKVYRNHERGRAFLESDPLGGHDPYSASKAASEMVIQAYQKSYLSESGVGLAAARAGNAIGGGDWSEERLLPDAIKAWQGEETLHIRRPNAVRPWQHVVEPLFGYIKLAESIFNDPKRTTPYNLGPDADDNHTVRSVVGRARAAFGKGEVSFANEYEGPHEAGLLSLDNSKAKQELGIYPRWSIDDAVDKSMNWYRAFYNGGDARALCYADIEAFEADG
ncbi:CDP-glucose 4,6-dehydratase [Maritalea sp.]|uniref:CDP-glucose 4,6-dehydratase n=1 Tax=Maritalea sp. TaxID=2003361 RepID=UPI003EF4C08A